MTFLSYRSSELLHYYKNLNTLSKELKYPIKRMNFGGILIMLLSKYRVFAKFRTIDNNDIGIPRNVKISIITKSKCRESSQFRGYCHRSFEILRNSDIVINETSKFHESSKFRYHRCRNSAKFRNFVNNNIGIPQNLERSMSVSSKLWTFEEFWFRYYWNFNISRNSDIVIIDSSKFCKNSIFQ